MKRDKCRCEGPTYERKDPEVRRKEILDAAVEVAQDLGYLKVTHSRIAAAVCVSPSLVRKYFESKSRIRDAIMGEAVRLEILDIVLQGIAAKDPIAYEAPATLRAAALESCA
jgi:AcrR family transcriptional regulator